MLYSKSDNASSSSPQVTAATQLTCNTMAAGQQATKKQAGATSTSRFAAGARLAGGGVEQHASAGELVICRNYMGLSMQVHLCTVMPHHAQRCPTMHLTERRLRTPDAAWADADPSVSSSRSWWGYGLAHRALRQREHCCAPAPVGRQPREGSAAGCQCATAAGRRVGATGSPVRLRRDPGCAARCDDHLVVMKPLPLSRGSCDCSGCHL